LLVWFGATLQSSFIHPSTMADALSGVTAEAAAHEGSSRWLQEDLAPLRERYEEEGYVVLPGFVSADELVTLKARAHFLLRQQFGPDHHPQPHSHDTKEDEDPTIFSTKDQPDKTNKYFLESGDKIRFFFEENAFDEQGQLKQDKMQSINKIAHALHDMDPEFSKFSRKPEIERVARQLIGFQNPILIQSMYIFKQPRIGGEVSPHQDSTFLYTEPMSCVAFWFAFEDATRDNGCLWVIPRSHKNGIKRRFVRDGESVTFKPPKGGEPDWDLSAFIPVEVPAGAMVLMHGSLAHMSYENKSNQSRQAYTFHIIEGSPYATYAADNWLQRPDNPPRGFKKDW